jgi:hypothetical protein
VALFGLAVYKKVLDLNKPGFQGSRVQGIVSKDFTSVFSIFFRLFCGGSLESWTP